MGVRAAFLSSVAKGSMKQISEGGEGEVRNALWRREFICARVLAWWVRCSGSVR